METLNVQSFKEKVFDFESHRQWKFNGSRPAIVDFYADWCAPCRALSPILSELAKDYAGKVDVYKVNTQDHPELANLFDVRGIPALLFIPVSGAPTMAAGFMPRGALEEAMDQVFGVK